MNLLSSPNSFCPGPICGPFLTLYLFWFAAFLGLLFVSQSSSFVFVCLSRFNVCRGCRFSSILWIWSSHRRLVSSVLNSTGYIFCLFLILPHLGLPSIFQRNLISVAFRGLIFLFNFFKNMLGWSRISVYRWYSSGLIVDIEYFNKTTSVLIMVDIPMHWDFSGETSLLFSLLEHWSTLRHKNHN